MLLNRDGYWLFSESPGKAWGFMFEDMKDIKMGNLNPHAWQRIRQEISGQFYLDKNLYTFNTVHPLKKNQWSSAGPYGLTDNGSSMTGPEDYFWKVVYRVPPDLLYRHAHELRRTFLLIFIILMLVAAGGAFMVARANEKRRIYQDRLKESNRMKDLFSDIMSHDLKNPVGVILSAAEIMDDEVQEEGYRKMIGLIMRNAKKSVELIDNASTYSRLEDESGIDMGLMDLGVVLEDMVSDFEFSLREKNMTLSMKIEKRHTVIANRMIHDLFSNIISNAVKYGPPGSTVGVKVKKDKRDWIVCISDSGEGIPDKDKETVFNRFERAGKGSVKGSGIGLAIAKRITALHRGRIWIEDNPGGGSVFCVRLPMAEKE